MAVSSFRSPKSRKLATNLLFVVDLASVNTLTWSVASYMTATGYIKTIPIRYSVNFEKYFKR